MKSQALFPHSREPSVLLRSSSASQKPSSFSPFQAQMDASVSHFVENATDWKSIAAMMAGSLAYRWGKMGVMGLDVEAHGRAPLRVLAIAVGLTNEVTAFEVTNRTLQTLRAHGRAPLYGSLITDHPSPNLWSWSGRGGLKEGLLSSFVTFATLKSFGKLTEGQNLLVQHGSQDLSMVLGHQLLHKTGLGEKPEGSWGEQLLRAEETNLQLGLGMQLVHSLAPALPALERDLDFSSRPLKEGRSYPSGYRQGSPLQKTDVTRRWGILLEKNSLLSLGPLAVLEDFFREIHQRVGTTPLILTGLGIAGLAIGKILHSRYKLSKSELRDSAIKEEKDPAKEDIQEAVMVTKIPVPKTSSKDEFGVLSPLKVRSFFLMSLADIILFQETAKVLPRVRKVEEGLSHPDPNVRMYLLETLGELMPSLSMKDRLPRVKTIESMLEDPQPEVRLQALKSLAWSLQFLLPEERGSRFLKIEGFWSDPHPLFREAAVDLILENLNFLPTEEKLKWIPRMQEHMKSPHLEIRAGAFEALDQLDPFGRF